MKLVRVMIFLTMMLFSMFASASEDAQLPMSDKDLDDAIVANIKEMNFRAARVMMEASAMYATERILLKEKLDADPNNKRLLDEYKTALMNEKKIMEITKQFILSMEK